MASAALAGLLAGIVEIEALQRANPSPLQGGGFRRPEIVRAIGRAEVVLLSGHFERYLYALNDETCQWIVGRSPRASAIPEAIRLLHSRARIDDLAETQWDRRADKLTAYSLAEAALWRDEPVVVLDPDEILSWMKAPHCRSIVRCFRAWGIDDVFSSVTRTAVNRQRLWIRLSELVEKRNGIAHGDLTVEARYLDIQQYKAAVKKFCASADRLMARTAGTITAGPPPW